MYFNKNFMLAALLVVVLFAGVTLGCCQMPENFENATPMKKTLEESLKEEVEKVAEKETAKEDEKLMAEAKKVITATTDDETPVTVTTTPLNKQEQELFEQITKNSLSNNDLKKLISAGILTENMVEKFLNKIDEGSEEKIEGFCSGGSCYASVHWISGTLLWNSF